MADSSLYILAGYDDLTEERLAGIQNHLYEQGFSGVQTKDVPMHFTLGSYDLERKDELKARMISLSKSLKPFDVGFNYVGLFRLPQNDVLFTAPEVSREMLELKDHFRDDKDTFPWSAHTTFLIDKPDVISDALKIVMSDFKAFTGKVTTLHLYEFFPARHILSVRFINDERDWLLSEEAYSVYKDSMYQPTYERYIEKMNSYLLSPSVMITLCKLAGANAGFMVLDINGNGAEILGIAISKTHRGQGLGRQMIRKASKLISGQLCAETDDDAVGFYRNCGFTIEETKKQYPNGVVKRYVCRLGE